MTTPHVVMLVSNDVRTDTRVRKSALAVAALGVRVTVVGLTTGAVREHTDLGPVRIVRVPVVFRLRDARKGLRSREHAAALPLVGALEDDAAQVERLRQAARARDLRPRGGGTLRRQVLRVRHRLGRRAPGPADRAFAALPWWGLHRLLDKASAGVGLGASWRRLLPEVDDWELAIGPLLDALQPDVIHAHDVQLMGVAARASQRARTAGRTVPWVYDAHEWVRGLSQYRGRTRRGIAAWTALEAEHIGLASRVVTVSPQLALLLQQHYRLPVLPDVVLNVPPVSTVVPGSESVRAASAVPAGVPLLVYSGGVQEARGVQTAVAALPLLPDAHLAVVAVPSPTAPPVLALVAQAEQLGVAGRLHVLPPVAPDRVAAFLSTADVGLIPLRHFGSHEVALANKLFEYLHAGVPVVVSDCEAQAAWVREHGTGLVHRADDPADLARALTDVLRDPVRFQAAPSVLERHTWQAQVERLQGLYRDLLHWDGIARPVSAAEPAEVPVPLRQSTVLALGPANSAGQGWAWSQAVRRVRPEVGTNVLARRNSVYDFPADELVAAEDYLDVQWSLVAAERAASWSHALLEAGRPILGQGFGRDFRGDLDVLGRLGIRCGLVFHGSEVRDPRRHARTHPYSPFRDASDPLTRRLQARCDALLPLLDGLDLPMFVSTPDQLAYVPGATWLPVVVDTDVWVPRTGTLERPVPVVVHAPSSPALKGTAVVQEVCGRLAADGLIDFRLVTGLPPARAAELVAGADVVIDQLLLGLYGVLACEGMASGRLVLGHVGDDLRSRVPSPIPVVEATPDTLEQVLRRALADRDWAREQAAGGPAFVATHHDGRQSAEVLATFLDR